ncbi:putative Proteasome component PUP2 [Gigaspora margarita]|uniref:Putative Proteasome component PUP2 n=1 Tax=Gigaspora margarita TaxID=4874 RepID=A0A8H3X2E4_GIGMA|nr:putative Proteasome component PUP2 [Gigaspora margarita]
MFKRPFKKISNIFRSSLKTPPSINFKRFFSPVTNIPRPFSPPPPSIRQQRNFFGFDALSSRRSYNGHKVLGYTQKQLYDVVSNIDDYHLFIPFCTNSEVLKTQYIDRRTKILTAALGVGFQGFSETYVSEVTCERPCFVQAIASSDALFKHLVTTWRFTPHEEFPSTHCNLDFNLDFEFASSIHAQVANVFFDQVNELIVTAFEERCNQVYGPPINLQDIDDE